MSHQATRKTLSLLLALSSMYLLPMPGAAQAAEPATDAARLAQALLAGRPTSRSPSPAAPRAASAQAAISSAVDSQGQARLLILGGSFADGRGKPGGDASVVGGVPAAAAKPASGDAQKIARLLVAPSAG